MYCLTIDTKLGRIEGQLQQARRPHQRESQRNARQRRSVGPSFLHQPSDTFVQGSWTFVESPDTIRRRERHQKEDDETKLRGYSCTYYYDGSFGKAGNSDGVGLKGEHYPTSFLQSNGLFYYRLGLGPYSSSFLHQVPGWSNRHSECRLLLSQLTFNGKAEIQHKSGIYKLNIKYSVVDGGGNDDSSEAGIIVGEVEFNNRGYVVAEGADWDRLLTGQRQNQLPYSLGARGTLVWTHQKISEPWKDGDILKFTIDTNENTIVFQKGNTPKKVFWNVLYFTNNTKYPEYLRLFAYCGGQSEAATKNELTIVQD